MWSAARTRPRCVCSRSSGSFAEHPCPAAFRLASRRRWRALEEGLASLVGRPPLLTRGAVEIFRHDWPLDSVPSVEALGYTVTPLERGLQRLLDPGAGTGSTAGAPE